MSAHHTRHRHRLLQLRYLISSFQFGVELAENLLQLFTDHVGQNIETPPRSRGSQVSVCRWLAVRPPPGGVTCEASP